MSSVSRKDKKKMLESSADQQGSKSHWSLFVIRLKSLPSTWMLQISSQVFTGDPSVVQFLPLLIF
jgi:hypothetical protein